MCARCLQGKLRGVHWALHFFLVVEFVKKNADLSKTGDTSACVVGAITHAPCASCYNQPMRPVNHPILLPTLRKSRQRDREKFVSAAVVEFESWHNLSQPVSEVFVTVITCML